MCKVEPPLVYSSMPPTQEKPWLTGQAKIIDAGVKSQSHIFRGVSNPAEAECYNRGLHACAKSFFKTRKHLNAHFVPYIATVNHEHFANPKLLPSHYFYRLLLTKIGAKYSSHWSPNEGESLNIWNENGFISVLYGFLEEVSQEKSEILDIKDSFGNDLKLHYECINLHNSPFVYWLEIPQNARQYADK